MKKFVKLTISLIVITVILSGCGKDKVNDTDINQNKRNSNSVEGFDGNINTSWDEVNDEYNAIEIEAKREIDSLDNITADDIKNLTNTIRNKYEIVKNGITDENEEDAKELYKASIKLQELLKKDGTPVEHEITHLAENAEELVKHYYGEADRNFNDVVNDFENGLDNIKDYTIDKWNELLDLLK